MSALDTYRESVLEAFNGLELQRDGLETAALWLAEALQQDGLLYVAGSGHSHMLAEEVFYRAGGLAAVYPLLEPSLMLHEGAVKASALERLEGFAALLLDETEIGERDLLVVVSNSGRNAFPIEVALEAKRRGCKTVALTSLAHSGAVSSRHASGKRLFEVADLVLDNGAPYGDAVLEIPGLESNIGAVSSLTGIYLLNAVVVRAIERCAEIGFVPDIFVSANAAGGGQTLDLKRWQARIKRL